VYRIALGIVIALLVVAEIVRPTQLSVKKISSASSRAMGAVTRLDPEQLADLPPIVAPALGNIDAATIFSGAGRVPVAVARITPMSSRDDLDLVGWCADPEARAPGAALLAIVDGRRIDASGAYGRSRPDVAKHIGVPAMDATGFDVRLRGSELGLGTHTVRIGIVAADRRGLFLFPTPEDVNVVGPP
jgi:hypothetical protein